MMKIVIVKITKWGACKLGCIKAIKDLMDLTLREAKDIVENSEMPCVLKVYNDEKLKVFKDYTQAFCSGINYTVEDINCDVDAPNEEASEDYSEKTVLAISKMEEGQKCVEEAKQMLLDQIRFLNTSLKGVVSHKEMLLKENNDLCIQLREEIARLKHDNDILRENKKVVESNNDSLMIANKSLREDVQRLNEIIQAIKNLTL